MIRINLPFDILEGFSVSYFSHQKMSMKRLPINAALVFYKLSDDDYGLVTSFALRKINNEQSEFGFIEPEMQFRRTEISDLILNYIRKHHEMMPINYDPIIQALIQNGVTEGADIDVTIKYAGKEIAKELYKKRAEIFNNLTNGFVLELKKDYPREVAESSLVENSGNSSKMLQLDNLKGEPSKGLTQEEPWKMIPAKGNDQEIVRLWHKGLSGREIGVRLHINPGWVHVRISQLRRIYTPAIIPYRKSKY